jgi:hypothetical protein
MMDSVTRFAVAQREIGLAIGEPPTTRGYTPSVFAMLPRLLERTGAGEEGSITALYTVLVEGDDMNEPVADSVRGILDGHIVLSRSLAHFNHYPAIDVLESVSRLTRDVCSPAEQALAGRAREQLALYRRSEDLISIGAHQKGANPALDQAIALHEPLRKFLRQGVDEHMSRAQSFARLGQILAARASRIVRAGDLCRLRPGLRPGRRGPRPRPPARRAVCRRLGRAPGRMLRRGRRGAEPRRLPPRMRGRGRGGARRAGRPGRDGAAPPRASRGPPPA